jgi:hypothetical protein
VSKIEWPDPTWNPLLCYLCRDYLADEYPAETVCRRCQRHPAYPAFALAQDRITRLEKEIARLDRLPSEEATEAFRALVARELRWRARRSEGGVISIRVTLDAWVVNAMLDELEEDEHYRHAAREAGASLTRYLLTLRRDDVWSMAEVVQKENEAAAVRRAIGRRSRRQQKRKR